MSNAFSRIFKSKKATEKRVPTLAPNQMDLYDLMMQGVNGQGPFAQVFGGYDPEEINRLIQTGVGDPARKQLMERNIPAMQQSAVAGGMNRSSGVQRMAQEGMEDLEEQINALSAREQMGAREAAINRQHGGIESLFRTPTSKIQTTPGQPGFFEQYGPQAIGAASSAFFGPLVGKAGEYVSRQMFKR